MDEPELKKKKPITEKQREGGLYSHFKKADKIADEVGTDWIEKSACAGSETPDIWFPDSTHQDTAQREATAKAVNICFNECPVRLLCLKTACVAKERYGIWGGLTSSTRRGERSPIQGHDFKALSELPNPYE